MAGRKTKLDRSLDEIYSGPLAEFIAKRNALAKELRSDDADESGRISKLSKPSRAAGAANALALTKPKSVKALIDLTGELRDAMSGELDRVRVQDLTRKESELLERLLSEAGEIAEENGEPASKATLERVRQTLQAAQVDEDVREQLVAGRLTHEARAASMGVGNLLAMPAKSARPAKTGGKKKAASNPARVAKPAKRSKPAKTVDRKRVAKAREALAEAEKGERAAKRDLAKAEGALTKAQRAQEAAESRVQRAEAALRKASEPR